MDDQRYSILTFLQGSANGFLAETKDLAKGAVSEIIPPQKN